MTRKEFFNHVFNEIESNNRWSRSAWGRGLNAYVSDLLENISDDADLDNANLLKKALLYGAGSWKNYSWSGCGLIYDADIAERLCNPTELKKTRHGERKPNPREEWLDTQARALFQAANRILKVWHKYNNAA